MASPVIYLAHRDHSRLYVFAPDVRLPVMIAQTTECPAATRDLEAWMAQVRLRIGVLICIRPLRPDDREREVAFINSLSERTRYMRLFTPLKFLSRHLLDQLMDIDYHARMALVATVQQEGAEQFIGVARYGETDVPGTLELGVTVADLWQRRGVARLLIEQLAGYARAEGFHCMTGLVLPDNHAMIGLAKRLGFTVSYDPAQHLFHISRELHGQTRAGCGELPVLAAPASS